MVTRYWIQGKSMLGLVNAVGGTNGDWSRLPPEFNYQNWESLTALQKISVTEIVASYGYEFDRDE